MTVINLTTSLVIRPPSVFSALRAERALHPHSSGPAFQPINTFLRQIAGLSGVFRSELAQHPALTFACTVGHLCRAIRKLAAVATPEEATEPLWRGVRGELERAFWVPDEQGGSTASHPSPLSRLITPTLCLA